MITLTNLGPNEAHIRDVFDALFARFDRCRVIVDVVEPRDGRSAYVIASFYGWLSGGYVKRKGKKVSWNLSTASEPSFSESRDGSAGWIGGNRLPVVRHDLEPGYSVIRGSAGTKTRNLIRPADLLFPSTAELARSGPCVRYPFDD
jgi:hypothetical protein